MNVRLLLFVALLGLHVHSDAAFCSLRDPVESIRELYPTSTSFKSAVRLIDTELRDQIQHRLTRKFAAFQ